MGLKQLGSKVRVEDLETSQKSAPQGNSGVLRELVEI